MSAEETQQRYTWEQWQAIYALPADQRLDPANWSAPIDVTVRHHTQEWRSETEQEYRTRLDAMPLEELLPGYDTTVFDGQGNSTTTSGTVVRTPEVYVPSEAMGSPDFRTGLSVLLLNPNDGTAIQTRINTGTTVQTTSTTVLWLVFDATGLAEAR